MLEPERPAGRRTKRGGVAIATRLVTVAGVLAWALIGGDKEIRPGATEAEVAKSLGKPDAVMAPRPSHNCGDEPVPEAYASERDRQCVRQWLYWELPGACYSVCFGADGKVVSTYHYISP